jgi:hypothetical protein
MLNKAVTALAELDQLNRHPAFPEQATKEDISALAIENYYEALDALGERAKAVGYILDREPLKPILSDEEGEGEEEKPAPKRPLSPRPSDEQLKAIRDKIEKAKAQLTA